MADYEWSRENLVDLGFAFNGETPVTCPPWDGDLLARERAYGPGVRVMPYKGLHHAYDEDNRLYLTWPDPFDSHLELTLTYVFSERHRVILNADGEPDQEGTDGWRANILRIVARWRALREIDGPDLDYEFTWYGDGRPIYSLSVRELRELLMDDDENRAAEARERARTAALAGRGIDWERVRERRRSLLSEPTEEVVMEPIKMSVAFTDASEGTDAHGRRRFWLHGKDSEGRSVAVMPKHDRERVYYVVEVRDVPDTWDGVEFAINATGANVSLSTSWNGRQPGDLDPTHLRTHPEVATLEQVRIARADVSDEFVEALAAAVSLDRDGEREEIARPVPAYEEGNPSFG